MTSPELPPALAKVADLGPVEAVYRSVPPSMKQKFLSWLIATVIVGLIWAVGHFGEAALKQQGMEMVAVGAQMLGVFGLVVVGGVWLLVLLFLSFVNRVASSKPQVIALYRDGIACLGQGKVRAWPWADIRAVYAEVYADQVTTDTGVGALFTVAHRDGSRFTINHLFAGWQQLIDRVRREVDSRVGPEVTRAFEAGQPVPFGDDLVVEREGVRVAKKLIPWDAIRGCKVERGMLVLRAQKSSPAQVPVAAIPNLELLLGLLRRNLPQVG